LFEKRFALFLITNLKYMLSVGRICLRLQPTWWPAQVKRVAHDADEGHLNIIHNNMTQVNYVYKVKSTFRHTTQRASHHQDSKISNH